MYVTSYRLEPNVTALEYFYIRATFLLNGKPVTGAISSYYQASHGTDYHILPVDAEADEVQVLIGSTDRAGHKMIVMGTLDGKPVEYAIELPVAPHGADNEITVVFELPTRKQFSWLIPAILGVLAFISLRKRK